MAFYRRCPRCKKSKDRSKFGRNAASPSGLQTYCRSCSREVVSEHYARNRQRKKVVPPYEMKKCSTCKKRRHISKFNKNLSLSDGLHNECKGCAKSRWYKNNYGVDREGKKQLLRKQKGRCASCRDRLALKASHVDHCHRTKKIRGVLCRACNVGLGCFKDSPERLRRAIKYVLKKR